MIWIVLIFAVSVGLAVAATKMSGLEGRARSLTLLLVFFGTNAVARRTVLPELRVWHARQGLAEFMDETRLFALLEPRHPEVGGRFTELILSQARRGAAPAEAYAESAAFGRSLVSPVFAEYARTASGESLTDFVSVVVDTLDGLSLRDDDSCYFWMFGGELPEGLRLSDAVSDADAKLLFEAMANVVESSVEDPTDPPDPRHVQEALGYLQEGLLTIHGPDFAESLDLLGNPRVPEDERMTVCEVTVEVYRQLLAMSQDDSEVLARGIFGDSM